MKKSIKLLTHLHCCQNFVYVPDAVALHLAKQQYNCCFIYPYYE